MREEIFSISSACRPITERTEVKGIRYACGCKDMSGIRGFFERIKRVRLHCFSPNCLEHGQGIDRLFGRKK